METSFIDKSSVVFFGFDWQVKLIISQRRISSHRLTFTEPGDYRVLFMIQKGNSSVLYTNVRRVAALKKNIKLSKTIFRKQETFFKRFGECEIPMFDVFSCKLKWRCLAAKSNLAQPQVGCSFPQKVFTSFFSHLLFYSISSFICCFKISFSAISCPDAGIFSFRYPFAVS